MWQRRGRRELLGCREESREVVVGLVERGVDLEEVGGVSGGGKLFGHVGCLL